MNYSILQDIVSNFDNPDEIFVLWDKLGQGAFGSVYKGIHKITEIPVAVKILPLNNNIEILKKEIDIMKECNHQNIIGYIGTYLKHDELWIVLEYCAGGSIFDIIRANKSTLNETQISSVCESVLRGLNYLHGHKKIHRDVKCANILLDHRGIAKLADFGVSAHLSNKKNDGLIGSPFWMSPEVINRTVYNHKTDIWSLGITAIEMGEGEPPFSHVHPVRVILAIQNNPAQSLSEPQRWSSDFNNFISQCLIIDPLQRPSAKDLLSHPFIKNSSSVLADFVQNSLTNIEKYRTNLNYSDSEIESEYESLNEDLSSTIIKDS